MITGILLITKSMSTGTGTGAVEGRPMQMQKRVKAQLTAFQGSSGIGIVSTSSSSSTSKSIRTIPLHATMPDVDANASTGIENVSSNSNMNAYNPYTDVPLVFIPGLKGTHLSYYENIDGNDSNDSTSDSDTGSNSDDEGKQNLSLEARSSSSGKGTNSNRDHASEGEDKDERINNIDRVEEKFLQNPLLQKMNLPFLPKQKNGSSSSKRKRRAWLTLGGLLNVPPLPPNHPTRSLALPLTYTYQKDGTLKQDRGSLFPDGVIDYIVQLKLKWSVQLKLNDDASNDEKNMRDDGNDNGNGKEEQSKKVSNGLGIVLPQSDIDFCFFPFYGHVTEHLNEVNERFQKLVVENSEVDSSQSGQDLSTTSTKSASGRNIQVKEVKKNNNESSQQEQHSQVGYDNNIYNVARPTAIFQYDWRRSLRELTEEFDAFCEETFPGQIVQVVAHSMGGLISYGAMRHNPLKYQAGGVMVGVPFRTGTQYLQDMHKGYYTELNRCQQFTPKDQFTFSSHWIFFDAKDDVGDGFVDVTKCDQGSLKFDTEGSTIGKVKATTSTSVSNNGIGNERIYEEENQFRPAVEGEKIGIDFYNANDWEKYELGIFQPKYIATIDEETLDLYRNHLNIQLYEARRWRKDILGNLSRTELEAFPPLVLCATDTVPTVNQVLRRQKQSKSREGAISRNTLESTILDTTRDNGRKDFIEFEYDYVNGRSVPGDGRIDFDKAFPLNNVSYEQIPLGSVHAKQMCWSEAGGDWETVWKAVSEQIYIYNRSKNNDGNFQGDLAEKKQTEKIEEHI